MTAPGPILVVEDDEDNRGAVVELLGAEGYAVVEAGDGREALHFLTDQRNAVPSLIILDLSMPHMTGWEMLAALKDNPRLALTPIVVVSGVKPELDPHKHGSIAGFLGKPYHASELLFLVRAFAGREGATT